MLENVITILREFVLVNFYITIPQRTIYEQKNTSVIIN